MLEPVPMVRLTAVILERDERAALQALGRLGLLELIQARAGPDTAPREPPHAGDGTLRWARLLERLEHLQGALGLAGGLAPAREGSPDEVERGLQLAEERARGLLGRREELLRRQEELSAGAERLRRYRGLGIPLARVETGAMVVLRAGSVPAAALDELRRRAGARALILALAARPGEGKRWLVALGLGRDRLALEAALRASGFEEEALPRGRDGTLEDLAAATGREAEQVAGERARLDQEVRAFSEELIPALAGIEARVRLELGLEEARRCSPRTESALLLQGWIPAADAPAAERCVQEATGRRCVLELVRPGAEEEDRVPVLLRSSRLLRPFEKLVAGYGLPRYRELSPTPFLAVSYLVMFGMMFGDVGHGAVLAAVGLAGLVAGRWREASVLLLACGLSSSLAGLVYGSWFGLDRFRSLALWRDPLEGDPLRFLALGILVGVLTISAGVILNVLDRLRHHDLVAALMDRYGLAGLVFYWTGLALLLRRAQWTALAWPMAAVLLLAVAAWLLEGPVQEARRRRGRSPPGRGGAAVAGRLVEAFETMLVYLANTISFVRLAAYGMSHAALLLAILMTARAVARPGGPLFVLVLVAGNLVAILLEGIIAAVQALRLEYYEFFGKFFSGAGRAFQPFRLEPTGGGA